MTQILYLADKNIKNLRYLRHPRLKNLIYLIPNFCLMFAGMASLCTI